MGDRKDLVGWLAKRERRNGGGREDVRSARPLMRRSNLLHLSTHRVSDLVQLGPSDGSGRSSLEQLGESLDRLEEGRRRVENEREREARIVPSGPGKAREPASHPWQRNSGRETNLLVDSSSLEGSTGRVGSGEVLSRIQRERERESRGGRDETVSSDSADASPEIEL